MRRTFAILCTLGLIALGTDVLAATGWEIPLTVSTGHVVQHLSFGEREDATIGVDGLYEVPALPGGAIQAAFEFAGTRYWRDIRPLTDTHQSWKLIVTAPRTAGEVTVAWGDLPRQAALLARLEDPAAGQVIDAASHKQYRFRNNGTRTLILDVARQGE